MGKLSLKKLADELKETEKFTLPAMTEGAKYLYDNLYRKLLRDDEVRLSEIKFDVFEAGDLESLCTLHSDVLEKNEQTIYGIITELREIAPVYNTVNFV